MNKKIFILLVSLIVSSGFLFSQPTEVPGQMPANGVISGKILDDTDNPVEYATITIHSLKDSSIVTGGITNNKGEFKFTELKLGAYYMVIKLLGFESKEINPIYLFPKGRGPGQGTEQDFGSIKLSSSSISLNEVNVVADKNHVQYKIDKKVVNVSQDINSASGTAVDVLQNIPSVSVDLDGNVALRGSGSFTVLIDGKPSALEGSEALQAIPANMIENIEIITNPSAKFDPDGAAGIINIILKKRKSLGLNGIVNASVGTNDKYSGSLILNYKIGKFNLTGGFDYRDETRYGSGLTDVTTTDTSTFPTTFYYNDSYGNRNFNNYGIGFQFGIDYYINDNNTLSLTGRGGNREFNRVSSTNYHTYTNPVSSDVYYLRNTDGGFGGNMGNYNLDFEHKFKKPGQKLNASVNYSSRNGTRLDHSSKYLTDQDFNINDDNPELSKQDQIGPDDEFRYKLDYVSPIGETGSLETGYQGRNSIEKENFVYSDYDPLNDAWIKDPLKSSDVNFYENIHAVYGTYASKIWGFEYKIGLRTEYFDRLVEQVTMNEEFKMDKFDFFPSAYITRQISKTKQVQVNYSRRINRPGGRQLNPFVDYSDPIRLFQGNPYLQPEYVDSYELNFQNTFKQSFVSIETFYRKTNNLISDVAYSLGGDTILRTFENLNYDNSLGVELNSNLVITKWWRFNASASAYFYQVFGEVEGQNTSNESFNWNLRINNSFNFKTKTRVQLTGFYNGPSANIQGTRKGFFFSNISVRQDMLKDKMSLTLSCQDVFGTGKFEGTTTTSTQEIYNKFSREARVFSLALTYRLNNFKQKRNGENGNNMEQEMNMEE
ncbi:MAG: TonB-dependent receptor [Bacteroidales bacterium]